jgi:hypothetical protein
MFSVINKASFHFLSCLWGLITRQLADVFQLKIVHMQV